MRRLTSRLWRRRGRIALLLLAAAALGLVLARSHVRTVLYSIYFLDGLSRLGHGSRLDPLLAHSVVRSQESISAARGERLVLDVYRPEGSGPWPALLIVPGFTKQGLDDPRMIALARLVAAAGVVVVLPALDELFEYRWSPEVTGRIAAAFDAMARRPDVRREHLGLFGISVSGGLGLAAATRPEVASRLAYTIAFAPYHDYAGMYRFILSGRYRFADEWRSRKPSPFSRWIFLYNYLHHALAPRDPEFSRLREVIRLRIYEQWAEADRLAGSLTPEVRTLLERLEGDDADFLTPLAERAIEESRPAAPLISPHLSLCNLRGRLYVLHGSDDDVIPVSESLELAEHCKSCPDLHCDVLLTGLYSHADMDRPSAGLLSTIRHRIPETLRYYAFLYRVLRSMLPDRGSGVRGQGSGSEAQ